MPRRNSRVQRRQPAAEPTIWKPDSPEAMARALVDHRLCAPLILHGDNRRRADTQEEETE